MGQYLKIRPRPLPTKSLPIHYHSLIIRSSRLYSLLIDKALLNTLSTNQIIHHSLITLSFEDIGIYT
jgi:hypothetical protein